METAESITESHETIFEAKVNQTDIDKHVKGFKGLHADWQIKKSKYI